MSERQKGQSSSRERILDAASQLVCEIGAGRLTLDAVADRAGLSKGGLLYSFPSKDDLLRGMVERMVADALSDKAALSSALSHKTNVAARVAIEIASRMRCSRSADVASGLLRLPPKIRRSSSGSRRNCPGLAGFEDDFG